MHDRVFKAPATAVISHSPLASAFKAGHVLKACSLCSATCTGGKGTNVPGGCSIQAGPGPAPFPPAATAGLFLGFSLRRMVGTCACLSGIVGVSLSPVELCARRCPHGPQQDSQGTADLPLGSRRETLESGAGDY